MWHVHAACATDVPGFSWLSNPNSSPEPYTYWDTQQRHPDHKSILHQVGNAIISKEPPVGLVVVAALCSAGWGPVALVDEGVDWQTLLGEGVLQQQQQQQQQQQLEALALNAPR
jgi:hypothetical protein